MGTATRTDTYTYGDSTWKDLLTSYNGESIVYDEVGNPTTYRGKAFTWDNNIRKPIGMQTDDGYLSFSYDATGARRVKNYVYGDNTELHFYHYDGSTLLYESISTVTVTEEGPEFSEKLIEYLIDETGSPVGMIYDGTEYYFVKNLQGDIQRIYTANGTLVGEYHYDAWGNHTIVKDTNGIASLNPFRYRGYYYDSESGLYYLNSRYYDPETGRFVSADSIVPGVSNSVDGYNLFAYCFNNPVNMIDEDGNWPSLNTIIGVAVATLVVVATVVAFATVAPAALCTLTTMGMYMGASYGVATTVAALGMSAVGASAVAYSGDIAYSAVTGESPMLDNLFQGNEEAYNTGLMLTSMGMAVISELAAQSPGVCFVEGTLVLTSDGHTPIEKIQVGDLVCSENLETGEKSLKEVTQTFINTAIKLIHIYVNEEEIVTTPEHPFYVPNVGWTRAIELRAGDMLVMQNGKYIVVERIQHEILENPVTVYNFEVEDFHTYYVGNVTVLVHNSCEKMGTQKGNAPRSNQAQNKQFNSVVKEYGLSKKESRILHDAISGQGYSRDEIIGELISLFPKKSGGRYDY